MSVRRGTARLAAAVLLTAGAMLAGPAALAQEADPCAPAADGSVPEMCQGGMAPEPAPDDPCAPDAEGTAPEMCQGGEAPEQEPTDPTDPCPPQPVEPGDGVVTDGGDQAIDVGEPNPGMPPSDVQEDPATDGEGKPEPAPDEPVSSEPTMDAPVFADPGIICAFGVPVSAPVDSSAGGGLTAVPDSGAPEAAAPEAAAGGQAAAVGQLPRTGAKERLAALAAGGAALVVLGAGALALARRRELQL